GCDTALYRTAEAMRAELPSRLAAGPRVIKRNRGNGRQGVWKVEALAGPRRQPMVRVLDATKDASEEFSLDAFLARCAAYFEDGSVIDQPFQPAVDRVQPIARGAPRRLRGARRSERRGHPGRSGRGARTA